MKVNTVSVVTRSEAERGFPKTALYESTETNELIQLVPPAAMARDWGLIVSDFHLYVEYANAAARDAEAKNIKALVPLIKPAEKVHEHLNAIAKRDGFKHCSGLT